MSPPLTHQEFENKIEILKKKIQSQTHLNFYEDLIVAIDTSDIILFVNEKTCKIFGYEEKEMLSKNWFENFTPARTKKILLGETDGVTHYENQILTKLREERSIYWHNTPIKDKGGNITGFLSLGEDITGRKREEQELQKANNRLEKLQQAALLGLWELDIIGNKLIWSNEFYRIFGLKPQEIEAAHKTLLKIIHPKDKNRVKDAYSNFLKNKTPYEIEYRLLLKSGEIKCILEKCETAYNGKGEPVHSIGTVLDITKQAQLAEKLKNSEERLSQIIKVSKDWIWEIDTNGLYTYASEKVEDILGYKSAEIVNKKYFYDFFPEENREKLKKIAFKSFKQKKTFSNFITPNISKNGDIVWFSTSGTPILDNKGNLIGYIGADDDITKRIKTEKKLINAKSEAEESDRLKDEFIQNMSHEIRTPMNAILGFSEMLSIPDLTDKKRAHFVEIIQNSGNQLVQIIDDILEISRLETKQIKVIEELVNLNDLFLNLFSIFNIKSKEKKIPLYLKKGLSDRQSVILTDKKILNTAINNVLNNALKFTSKGFIELGYRIENSELEIYVKDTGIGIEPEKHDIIFVRFSQAEKELSKKSGGLGLGLSIAKENIKLLGGDIKLESKKGVGSTFFITIPYKPVYTNNEIDKKEGDIQNKHTILIAEDEEINYLYLEILLNDVIGLDCEIIHVKNGLKAVEKCKENPAIDFVLMDLKMPIMYGYDAIKQIKKLRPKLPIVVQTAYSRPEEQERAALAGCDDFVSKPISQEILKKMINKYLITKLI